MYSLSKAVKAGYDPGGEISQVVEGETADKIKQERRKHMHKQRAVPRLNICVLVLARCT